MRMIKEKTRAAFPASSSLSHQRRVPTQACINPLHIHAHTSAYNGAVDADVAGDEEEEEKNNLSMNVECTSIDEGA